MGTRCEAERLFPEIEKLIKKLSDGNTLGELDDNRLRELLNKYLSIECPFDGAQCLPNSCSYANPEEWIEYHRYTSMGDLLSDFEYEGIDTLELKDKKSIDALGAHWRRRPGHYSP